MQPNIVLNYIAAGVKDWTPSRDGNKIFGYVAHTTDCSLLSAERTFASGTRQAAAHDIVGLNGDDVREVAEGDTSWGAGNWFVNQRVINVEHEDNGNPWDTVRTPQMYSTAAWRFADVCRRYGVPCQRGTVDLNHNPVTWGLFKHSEVDQIRGGTSCCDGLDVERIVADAQALLGGPKPPVVEASAASVSGVNAWGPAKVRVMVQTLRVHNSPAITDAGNFANTPDGMLHEGNLADVNGWVRGQLVSQGGQTSDVYLHSPQGHFFWAPDTDFFLAAPDLPLVAPPEQITPQAGIVTVTPEIGANIRSTPQASGDNVVRAAEHGEQLAVEGFVSGSEVNRDTKWWVLADGNVVSNAVVSFNEPVSPAPAAPTAPTPPPAPVTVSVAQSLPGSGAGIAGDILPPDQIPQPTAPAQGADPMTVRDYLVAFVAWVMSPFIKK